MIVPFSEVLLHTLIDMWRQDHYRGDENRKDWARNTVQIMKKSPKISRRHRYQRVLNFAKFGVPTLYAIVLVMIIMIGLFNVYKMS